MILFLFHGCDILELTLAGSSINQSTSEDNFWCNLAACVSVIVKVLELQYLERTIHHKLLLM